VISGVGPGNAPVASAGSRDTFAVTAGDTVSANGGCRVIGGRRPWAPERSAEPNNSFKPTPLRYLPRSCGGGLLIASQSARCGAGLTQALAGMDDHRRLMISAFKTHLVPDLRRRGFKGSFPHFYRPFPSRADFLSIQFYSAGGSFVVEAAKCGADGIEEGVGQGLPLSKINTTYLGDRIRLGADPASNVWDHWFAFGPRNYDPPEAPKPISHYESIVSAIVELLDSQAEKWWNAC
jgi:hypothetical protein